MPQSIQDIEAKASLKDTPVVRFRKYARGRINHFAKRQILTLIGSSFVALQTTPMIGLIALGVALFGELLDCGFLSYQLKKLKSGARFEPISKIVTVSAGIQASCISICILMADFLPEDGAGTYLALTFLMSAALNAGLVLPYHKPSALMRLVAFFVSFVAILVAQFRRADGNFEIFLTNAVTMSMMVYMVFVILQFIISNHAKHLKKSEQILATSIALETSDKQKRESQENVRKLSLVAQHANDSIVISDPSGCITWVNDAFTKITGYEAGEAIGKTPAELLNDASTSEATTQKIARHIQQGKAVRADVLNRRKDGKKIWVETNLVPIKSKDNQVEMVVAIERDVTAIKEHEKELAEAKVQAEKGEQAKSEFLATMSHEIRTPMNGIMGLSDLLAQQDLPKEALSYATTIKESADALLVIINDVLDVSKLDAGQLTIDPVEFDLELCFGTAIELLSPQAAQKGIYLDIEQEERLPKNVIGDDGRVRQILLNVVGNAIKFTSTGGVTIRPKVEQVESGYLLTIETSDTGIGIAPDRLEQIFDKFQQADSKTTRKFGGTGLGLSISKQLANLMEGDLFVASEIGVGSTFSIQLKLGVAEHTASAIPNSTQLVSEIMPMTVLIAEDNKTNRFLISKYLKDLPLEIHYAHNGREAVEYTRLEVPNLIFMDMSMPEMDGLEATKRIRDLPEPQPHIVALTANAFASDREACFLAGMDDFLAKPVKKADLLLKLAEFSAKRQINQL